MYMVPDLTLIPQQKNMACWYASAQMLIQWKRNRARATLMNHPDPSQVALTSTWEVANNGVTNPQIIRLAETLGLKTVPPMSLGLDGIENLLRLHGPLWTNGKSHIVVLGGADRANNKVLVYDPLPVGAGKKEWRLYQWYISGGKIDSRDTSADVKAVFLYHP
jgi:ABC-type bacteriocin/lantibiotic exporter with double-glycine peptidase domain